MAGAGRGLEVRTAWVLARTTTRAGFLRFGRAVAPAWIAVLLAFVQLDTQVNWAATRELLLARSPTDRWALGLLAVGVWAAVVGPALQAALRTPEDRWRWRVPAGWGAQALAVVPLGLLSVLPLAGVGYLVGLAATLPAAAIGPALAWASRRPVHGLVQLGLSAGWVALGLWVPAFLPAAAAGTVLGAWTLHRSPPPTDGATSTRRLRLRAPLAAICGRDLLALWRLRPGVVVAALLVPAPAWAVEATAIVNHPLVGESAVRVGLVVLTLASVAGAAAVLGLPELLQGSLDARRSPLSPADRSLGLVAVGALLISPSWLAVVLAGSGGALRLGLHGLAMAAGAAWFAVGLGRPNPADRNAFLWWVITLGFLGACPWWVAAPGAGALALLAGWGTARTLAVGRRIP